ncbi:ATP-binding protein, partial [Streptomyces sp. BR123]|uniref:ATP-binding protein n=1 Tax=Streptomyces sp. BR123 TaxID=2749828 RepID=UPI0015C43A58
MTTSPGTLDDGSPGRSPLPADGRRRCLLLAGLPTPVARARAFTAQALDDWSRSTVAYRVDQQVTEDIVLVVAELVANAMLHAGGPLELALDASRSRLRVEVSDLSLIHMSERTRPVRISYAVFFLKKIILSPFGSEMYSSATVRLRTERW